MIGAPPESYPFQQRINLNGVQQADTFQTNVFSSAIGGEILMTIFKRLDVKTLENEDESLKLLD